MQYEDVYQLQRQVKRLSRRIQREQPAVEGMSQTTLQVLTTLKRANGPLRPSELGAELDMASSNVAAALRTLEAQRFVERRPDPEDGRKVFIELTDHAVRTIEEVRRSRHIWLDETINALLSPREQRVLQEAGDLMARIAAYQDHTD